MQFRKHEIDPRARHQVCGFFIQHAVWRFWKPRVNLLHREPKGFVSCIDACCCGWHIEHKRRDDSQLSICNRSWPPVFRRPADPEGLIQWQMFNLPFDISELNAGKNVQVKYLVRPLYRFRYSFYHPEIPSWIYTSMSSLFLERLSP